MKKAMILNGSPRIKNGVTAVLIQWCQEALKANNWDVLQYDLYKMDYRGCAHCDRCRQFKDESGCALQDDFQEILGQLPSMDLIVIASPVYCWSVSGCMSSALDRFYALFKEQGSLIKNIKTLGLFTAGGGMNDGLDLCIEMLKRLSAFGALDYIDSIAADHCMTSEDLINRLELKSQLDKLIEQLDA